MSNSNSFKKIWGWTRNQLWSFWRGFNNWKVTATIGMQQYCNATMDSWRRSNSPMSCLVRERAPGQGCLHSVHEVHSVSWQGTWQSTWQRCTVTGRGDLVARQNRNSTLRSEPSSLHHRSTQEHISQAFACMLLDITTNDRILKIYSIQLSIK